MNPPAPDAAFLQCTSTIDWHATPIVDLAAQIRGKETDAVAIAKASFQWVRDTIQHSLDFDRCEVTCKASDVLQQNTGYCYAKSHLLAAVLRASGIPAGFCYQRLTLDGEAAPFCLHGFNAVYLGDLGWYRMDAPGNKPGVSAEFLPPTEQLAFPVRIAGEYDFPEIWSEPLAIVRTALSKATSVRQLATCLPDWEPNEMIDQRSTAHYIEWAR